MKSEELRNRLHEYIDKATNKQLKNFLSVVEEDEEVYTVKKKYDHWGDPEFVKEMDRRMEDFESGRDKGIPWEQVHAEALERIRNKNKNGK